MNDRTRVLALFALIGLACAAAGAALLLAILLWL